MNFGSVTFFILIFADDNEVGFYEASGCYWTDMLIHFWVSIVLYSMLVGSSAHLSGYPITRVSEELAVIRIGDEIIWSLYTYLVSLD